MNKVTKILFILCIACMIVGCFQGIVSADASTLVSGIDGKTAASSIDASGLQTMASKVLGIIQIATAVLAVILIAVFGFKFVLGSAQEKADYQKSFIPLIVGVVVVFAATSIAKVIFSVAS